MAYLVPDNFTTRLVKISDNLPIRLVRISDILSIFEINLKNDPQKII